MNNDLRYDHVLMRRYWSGEMTNAERHALEKAALEDPFLADAMEGYANQQDLYVKADLAELQNRLTGNSVKKTQAPVVQMKKTNWLRYAAVGLFTIGIAALIFKMNSGGGESTKEIAQVDPVKKDTVVSPTSEFKKEKTDTVLNYLNADQVNTSNANLTKTDISVMPSTKDGANLDDVKKTKPATDVTVITFNEPKPKKESVGNANGETSLFSVTDSVAYKPNENEKVNTNNSNVNPTQNLFRGRVLDNIGQALPFAKIKINDQLSTYTDVEGNFVLVSSDTTMTIEVKSVGFVANQTNISNRRDNNVVQLQEDKIANTQVIATNTNNYRTKRKSAMRSEIDDAPQPQDGWYNYDAYLANNIDVEKQPSLQKMKGEVEVEVEVNAEGSVVNAAITKSLCEKCDAEALRLVKAGPKWRGKKGRKAKVLVRF